MKKLLTLILLICALNISINAHREQDSLQFVTKQDFKSICIRYQELNKVLKNTNISISDLKSQSQIINEKYEKLASRTDSLKQVMDNFGTVQTTDKKLINRKLYETNQSIVSNKTDLQNRTQWGINALIIIILALVLITIYLLKKLKKGSSSIDEVRKAQDALQSAQIKMQEESVKLDSKLVAVIEKHMENVSVQTDIEPDHSLALKVADEIIRVELNLSRMDPSIKGYKQLSKAIERMKNNFLANGYEIVDMLGKPYVVGMKVTASFITDENLKEGEQIITKVSKPQVNYNGKMIQSAQIQVSQSE